MPVLMTHLTLPISSLNSPLFVPFSLPFFCLSFPERLGHLFAVFTIISLTPVTQFHSFAANLVFVLVFSPLLSEAVFC